MENFKDNNITDSFLQGDFTGVTGNVVSDHYARNIYIKVFLKISLHGS